MKTPKRVRPQRTHNGVILPLPYTVRTVLPGGGCCTTQHQTERLAADEARWQMQTYGRQAEVVSAEG